MRYENIGDSTYMIEEDKGNNITYYYDNDANWFRIIKGTGYSLEELNTVPSMQEGEEYTLDESIGSLGDIVKDTYNKFKESV